MLVLTRRNSESIIVGNNLLKITVLKVKGNQVQIGIEAPKEIPVHREEIFKRINESKSN